MYICTIKERRFMRQQVFKLVLMEEADKFLDSLSDAVYEKIDYNIRKVAAGVKDP